MIPTYPHAAQALASTPDGVPLAPLLPVLCIIVGLLLGYLLCQAVIERLWRRCEYLAEQLDLTRAALESVQATATAAEVASIQREVQRLNQALTATTAAEGTARWFARPRGLL